MTHSQAAGKSWTNNVITDLCGFDLDSRANGRPLIERAPRVTLNEIRAKTQANFDAGSFA